VTVGYGSGEFALDGRFGVKAIGDLFGEFQIEIHVFGWEDDDASRAAVPKGVVAGAGFAGFGARAWFGVGSGVTFGRS
jgi:hypothetical protein